MKESGINKSMREIKHKNPIYESLFLALILAIAGGFLDAYTYKMREGKFATMQTGNLIMFCVKMVENEIVPACYYLVPVAGFIAGIFLTAILVHFKDRYHMHYHQYVLLVVSLLSLGAGFLPVEKDYNWLANLMVSFSAGIQVEAFKRIHGYSIMTTMCTGNLKNVAEGLYELCFRDRKKSLIKIGAYILTILFFCLGCVFGVLASDVFAGYAIHFTLIPYLVSFFLLFFEPLKREEK